MRSTHSDKAQGSYETQGVEIGFAALRGENKRNDDFTLENHWKNIDISEFSEQEQLSFFRDAIMQLQEYLECFGIEGASTVCAIFLNGEHISVLNVGDSRAFFCLIDEEGDLANSSCRLINTALHTPSERSERRRIGSLRIIDGQVDVCSVSRYLGMGRYQPAWISHEPDLYVREQKILKNKKAFVVNASRQPYSDVNEMLTLLAKSSGLSMGEVADRLVNLGMENDNKKPISVGVTQLNPTLKGTRYLAIFGGYRGNKVSALLHLLFDSVVLLHVQCQWLASRVSDKNIFYSSLENLVKKIRTASTVMLRWLTYLEDGLAVVSQCYQLYAVQLNKLVNHLRKNSTKLDIIQLDKQIHLLDCFSEVLQSPMILQKNQAQFCPTPEHIHIHYPPKFLYPLLEVVKSMEILFEENNAEEAGSLVKELQDFMESSEKFYQIANIIFSIRRRYDDQMPMQLLGSSQKEKSKNKEETEEMRRIRKFIWRLEYILVYIFSTNKERSLSDWIKDLQESVVSFRILNKKWRQQEFHSMRSNNLFFIPQASKTVRLIACLKEAISEMTELLPKNNHVNRL